ncbi:MAG: hypothetical protein J5800_09230 [Spirochaetales bacterium]|nr:hypothetical protein [Spirochaetales bacterium]
MPSRYYFLSSLPMLRFQDHAPLTWDRFMFVAKGNITESDYRLLCAIPEGKDCGNQFLKQWAAFNTKLDDAVNAQRRQKLGRQEEGGVAMREFSFENVASSAINAKNPLEAELILMRSRFDFLEEKKGFEPFSESALLSYALQLRILLRKDMFTVESGNEEYGKLFEVIQNEITMD